MDQPTTDTLATYQRVAEEYRERHADRSVMADAIETFRDALDDSVGWILDVGCGPGWESATLGERGFDVTAIDLAPAFLATAGEVAPDAARVRMDMRALGFADDAFDGLWACSSFLHVPTADALETLEGFRRVLRPNGVLFCAVARGEGERTADRETYGARDDRQFTLYTPERLRERALDAEFGVETIDESGEWLHLLARAE